MVRLFITLLIAIAVASGILYVAGALFDVSLLRNNYLIFGSIIGAVCTIVVMRGSVKSAKDDSRPGS